MYEDDENLNAMWQLKALETWKKTPATPTPPPPNGVTAPATLQRIDTPTIATSKIFPDKEGR
jgi:hypothetical protein